MPAAITKQTKLPESVFVLSVELFVLALLWLGILFLNTVDEQVAAWPKAMKAQQSGWTRVSCARL